MRDGPHSSAKSAPWTNQQRSVPTAVPKPQAARVQWIDAAKGIGIILVVIGHTLRGLETAKLISFAGDFGSVDAAIYAFHMPLMFMLSGLFIHQALPQDWFAYTFKHLQRLIWPLILWTYIFFACKILAGRAANTPMGWEDLPFFPLPPKAHFWFLWALFLGFLIIKGMYALSPRFSGRSLFWPVVMMIALLLIILWLNTGLYSPWTQQALVYLPYILVGMSIRLLLFTNPTYVLLGSIMLALLTLFGPLGSIDAAYDYGVAISVSAALVSALSLLSRHLSYAWLMVIGQASMAIYLSHTIVSALVRAVLTSIDIRDVAIHLVLGIGSGIILPLIAFLYVRSSERALKVAGW